MAFIEAKEINLKYLLSNPLDAYKVPLYQRPYAWREEQWRELLEDILEIKEDKQHFLGSIMVIPQPHSTGINYFQIVDGQQRLSTILILLAAIRDIERENSNLTFARHLDSSYLFAKDFQRGREIILPKIKLGKFDNEAIDCILYSKNPSNSHLIFKGYNFFKQNLQTHKDLETFTNTILRNIIVVQISAPDYLNAFRLFETLNDRGLELSAADLIKNYLLMKISSSEKILDKAIDTWNEMYEKIKNNEPVKFIRRYVMSKYSGKVSERKLYEELKYRIEKEHWTHEKIYDFIQDLNQNATFYDNICEATFDSEKINIRLRELHLVEVATSYTALLKIFPLYKKELISESEVIKILNLVENFHLRWGICDQPTSRLDDIYNKIALKIGNKNLNYEDILKIVKNVYQEFSGNINDDYFMSHFSNNPFRPSDTRTKYILWKLSKPTGETIMNISDIQTEHIIPQKLNTEWKVYFNKAAKLEDEEITAKHSNLINQIGNLTIIAGQWNNQMSNRTFTEKKKDYKKSEFAITKALTQYKQFSFEDVEKRGQKFAKLVIKKIWPWVFK